MPLWDKKSYFVVNDMLCAAMTRIPFSCVKAFPKEMGAQGCEEFQIDFEEIHWIRTAINPSGAALLNIDICEQMIENVQVHELTPKILLVEYTDAGDASLKKFIKAYIFLDNDVTGKWVQANSTDKHPMIAILVDDKDEDYRVAIADFRYYVCTNPDCGKYLDKTPDRYECPECLVYNHHVFFCNRECFDAGQSLHCMNCIGSLKQLDKVAAVHVRGPVAPDSYNVRDAQGVLFQTPDTVPKVCVVCGKGGEDVRRCKPCFRKLNVCVYYCGMECAKADSVHHRPACGKNRTVYDP